MPEQPICVETCGTLTGRFVCFGRITKDPATGQLMIGAMEGYDPLDNMHGMIISDMDPMLSLEHVMLTVSIRKDSNTCGPAFWAFEGPPREAHGHC